MLSEETWSHIRERHPEVSRYEELVKGVAFEPELILQGNRGERKAVKLVKTHLSAKYLVVVYRDEKSRKAIITAYFTSDLKKIKGDLVWKA
jgi:hypothetical protein